MELHSREPIDYDEVTAGPTARTIEKAVVAAENGKVDPTKSNLSSPACLTEDELWTDKLTRLDGNKSWATLWLEG